jgi:hypothetical protein
MGRMIRSVVAFLAVLAAVVPAGSADAQAPVRTANSKNVALFFDDELLKAATSEIEQAQRYETEALAHLLADCDVAPLMAEVPEVCARAINYFLVVNPPHNTALPRLILAMVAAGRELRTHSAGGDDASQRRAFERWPKIQSELAQAVRGRLQALARDRP